HAELVIRNVRMGGVLLHRADTARRRNEDAVIRVPPDIWIGRKIGWRALSHRRKAQAAGQTNRAGENASHAVFCTSGHWVLLCDTGQSMSKNKLYQYRYQNSSAAKKNALSMEDYLRRHACSRHPGTGSRRRDPNKLVPSNPMVATRLASRKAVDGFQSAGKDTGPYVNSRHLPESVGRFDHP